MEGFFYSINRISPFRVWMRADLVWIWELGWCAVGGVGKLGCRNIPLKACFEDLVPKGTEFSSQNYNLCATQNRPPDAIT